MTSAGGMVLRYVSAKRGHARIQLGGAPEGAVITVISRSIAAHEDPAYLSAILELGPGVAEASCPNHPLGYGQGRNNGIETDNCGSSSLEIVGTNPIDSAVNLKLVFGHA